MSLHLYDIASQPQWESSFAQKHISRQVHPTLPYDILDYTQVAQFSRNWNQAVLAARGLIIHRESLEVVSRPLGKFFNYNEPSAPLERLVGSVVVTDKADGSMGVSYLNPETGSLNISTRGSFTSEQAQHATARYLELYDGQWTPDVDYTYIWEIIYPTNRIVLNYGDMDDLILIGKVHTQSGLSVPASAVTEWKWKTVEQFDFSSLAEALAAAPRPNAEGFVVHFTETDTRVKIKQEDYITLHRVITGASSRRIWEVLSTGGDLDSWIEGMPEEFIEFIETTRDSLFAEFATLRESVETHYKQVLEIVPADATQKEIAAVIQSLDFSEVNPATRKSLQGMLFARHSGGEFNERGETKISESIWKVIRPEFEKPFWNLNGKVD